MKQELISGDEVDVIDGRRRPRRPGVAARVKRGARRRARHQVRFELRTALRRRDFLAV